MLDETTMLFFSSTSHYKAQQYRILQPMRDID